MALAKVEQHKYTVNPDRINEAADRIRLGLNGMTITAAELEAALVVCYLRISRGAAEWTQASQQDRADIFLDKAMQALSQGIVDVSRLPDAAAKMLAANMHPSSTH